MLKNKPMLEMSVVYTTLTRLGYDSKEYLDKADFSVVLDFNTPYTITQLGTATADMTDMKKQRCPTASSMLRSAMFPLAIMA